MKETYVTFPDKKIETSFEKLKKGKTEDKKLYNYITRAIEDIKKDKEAGVKLPQKIWPKIYVKRYKINNLYKYDLPNAWRLIYTIKEEDIIILNIILEWFSHKDYEKRFKY